MNYKTFETLTVGEYQELFAIMRSEMDDLDKSIECVAVLTGKTAKQVEEMDIQDFNRCNRELAKIFSEVEIKYKPIKFINIGGVKYRICYNPKRMSAGQYIDIMTFGKGNLIENLHKIFASLLIRARLIGKEHYDGTGHEILAARVQDINFITVHSTCVFFSALWNNFTKAIHPYLAREMEKKGISPNLIREMDLTTIMAGFTTLNR